MRNDLVICDTGVISRYLLSTPLFEETVRLRIGTPNIRITPVIRIELLNWVSGFRQLTKSQRASMLRVIRTTPLLHITQGISELAVELSNRYINSKASDTLIAATALYHDLPVYTLNKKDFQPLGVTLFE